MRTEGKEVAKNPCKRGSIKEDLIGQRFGRLIVISTAPSKNKRVMWHCKCDCGNEKMTFAKTLKNGNSTSCGCKQKETLAAYYRRKTLVGNVYGRLVVKSEYFKDQRRWCVCDCSCGQTKNIIANNLVSKNTISCGCAWDDSQEKKIRYKSIDDSHAVFRPMINNSCSVAKSKKLDFDLDLEYLFNLWEQQNGICPYTGVQMEIPQWNVSRKRKYTSASIDRIDSSKGYIKGNIQFVSVIANYAKNTFSHEEMIKFCKSVASFWKDKI